MTKRSVPTAKQLIHVAIHGDLRVLAVLLQTDIIVVNTLVNAGQAVAMLREQVEQLRGEQNEISVAILEAHAAAESLLERCAEAAHLILCDVIEKQERRDAARYN